MNRKKTINSKVLKKEETRILQYKLIQGGIMKKEVGE